MIKFHTHIEHSNRAKEKPPGPIQIVAHMATLGLLGSYEIASQTLKWLVSNKGSYSPGGTIRRSPWFDTDAFKTRSLFSDDIFPMVLRERRHIVDAKVYGNGIAHFYHELALADCLAGPAKEVEDVVLLGSGQTKSWWRYAVRVAWIDEHLKLKDLKAIWDLSPDTVSTHAHTRLLDLARLGMLNVAPSSNGREFEITAGTVGKTFYEEIFYPVVELFEGRIPSAL